MYLQASAILRHSLPAAITQSLLDFETKYFKLLKTLLAVSTANCLSIVEIILVMLKVAECGNNLSNGGGWIAAMIFIGKHEQSFRN